MIITQENAKEYVGKYLFAHKGMFHYYPLTVVKGKEKFSVIDRHGTRMEIPSEKNGGIFFDRALTDKELFRSLDCAPYSDF